jgi:hypothetical protein
MNNLSAGGNQPARRLVVDLIAGEGLEHIQLRVAADPVSATKLMLFNIGDIPREAEIFIEGRRYRIKAIRQIGAAFEVDLV